ncbi:MAG: hypothetical protein WAJ93_19230 [Candidatus Nitrosopolaris sp.]
MLIKNIVSLVKEYPPVRSKKKSNSGKKPVHSWEKLVCMLMVVFGSTYRNVQNVEIAMCGVRTKGYTI